MCIEVSLNLGALLYEKGRIQEAEVALERVLQIDPDFQPAQYNLDLIRKAMDGRKEKMLDPVLLRMLHNG